MIEKKNKSLNIILFIPIILAVALVPIIVTAKRFDIGLNSFKWFSDKETSIDLFLCWKGIALIILATIAVVISIFMAVRKGALLRIIKKASTPEMLCLIVYILMAILSTLKSAYRHTAFFGGYEQWEGLDILLVYGVFCIYTYMAVNRAKAIKLIVYALLTGAFLVGAIGILQFLHMDIFRTGFGNVLMNLFMADPISFNFNFSEGWVYATLYNPNYVGSYAALLLPITLVVSFLDNKHVSKVWTAVAMIASCTLTVTLLGSQSMTGCVGVVATIVFAIAFRFKHFVKNIGWKKIGLYVLALVVIIAVVGVVFNKEVKFGLDKIFNPHIDNHEIANMESTKDGLKVTTVNGKSFYVTIPGKDGAPYEVKDESGKAIKLTSVADRRYKKMSFDGFDDFRLYDEVVSAKNGNYDAIKIQSFNIDRDFTVAKVDDEYVFFTKHNKLDSFKKIDAFGFEKNQHFGDKRGYIWSRTIPLLKDRMLLGSGPNTFTMYFPNDDYIGKVNLNYDGVTVTKPHNLYLQIWEQTGFISLVAYLVMFLVYFIKSFKLYFNNKLSAYTDRIGFAVLLALTGYCVTGIANDSTVCVAPIYWIMLGLGMAINRLIKRREKKC